MRGIAWARASPRYVLAGLIVAQWVLVGAYALTTERNGWLFYQGGDQTHLYTSAWVLAGGHLPLSSVGYGWPFLLMPVALAAGPNLLVALPAVVVLQFVVLLPVALVCVYAIAARVAGRGAGYAAAAAWVIVPYALLPLWANRYHDTYAELLLPQALGLTGLADFPSMVCLLVAAAVLVRTFETGAMRDATVAGLAAGFAVGIKPSNALFLPAAFLALLVARRTHAGVAFGAAVVPAIVALATWKYRGLGRLPIVDPGASALAAPASVATDRYVDLDWSRLKENYFQLRDVLPWMYALLVLPLFGVFAAVQRSLASALLLTCWAITFIVAKGTSSTSSIENGSLLRLLIPAFPPLVILAGLAVASLWSTGREEHAPTRISRRLVGIALAIFGLLPVLVALALPPLREPATARYFAQNVLVPVDDSLVLEAHRRGDRTVLEWDAVRTPGTRVFYRVFRAPRTPRGQHSDRPVAARGIRCTDHPGAYDCRVAMGTVVTTRARAVVDSPGPGGWVYRVGAAANWRDNIRFGDIYVLSDAATVP